MSAAAIIIIVLSLILWIVVAYWMLANQPAECLDWRDQLVFAFWPLTAPAIVVFDVLIWAVGKLRDHHNG